MPVDPPPMLVIADFYRADDGEDPFMVKELDWNSTVDVREFAALANRWLRSEPGGSVVTTHIPPET